MIKLRALYQENIQAAEEKGRQAALQQAIQERRTALELILSSRFGGIDPELMTVIDKIIALPSNDYSQLSPQLFSISREDLLKRLEDLED